MAGNTSASSTNRHNKGIFTPQLFDLFISPFVYFLGRCEYSNLIQMRMKKNLTETSLKRWSQSAYKQTLVRFVLWYKCDLNPSAASIMPFWSKPAPQNLQVRALWRLGCHVICTPFVLPSPWQLINGSTSPLHYAKHTMFTRRCLNKCFRWHMAQMIVAALRRCKYWWSIFSDMTYRKKTLNISAHRK